MTYAYLDANVYNDIERGAVSTDDIDALQATLKSGDLAVRAGLVDFEESLGIWKKDRLAASRRLAIIRKLAGLDRLLNQPSDLLAGAFEAYAAGASMTSPLLPRTKRVELAASLEGIAAGNAKFDPIVDEILAGVRTQKESFQAGISEEREKTLREFRSKYEQRELRELPFGEFFEAGALGWAEDFAKPLGVAEACRERGLEGLLKVPAVRLAVGMTLSLIHSLISAGRLPDVSDAYDVWHAIQASTADVFVTNDGRFFNHMTRDSGCRKSFAHRQVFAGTAGWLVDISLPLTASAAARSVWSVTAAYRRIIGPSSSRRRPSRDGACLSQGRRDRDPRARAAPAGQRSTFRHGAAPPGHTAS